MVERLNMSNSQAENAAQTYWQIEDEIFGENRRFKKSTASPKTEASLVIAVISLRELAIG